MKQVLLIATTVILMSGITTAAMAQEKDKLPETAPYENYIQVNGSAEKEIVPDEIYVAITISENDTKGKVSVERMEQDMIAKLKSIGVDVEKDLTIGDMGSDWKTFSLKKKQARTTATYQLKVNSGAMLGKAYQALESIGISNMDVTRTSHSKMREFKNEVRMEAMKDAQTVAKSLAEAVGQTAGRAIYIVDYNHGGYAIRQDSRVMLGKMSGVSEDYYESPLEFNSIKITYSVTAKFELK